MTRRIEVLRASSFTVTAVRLVAFTPHLADFKQAAVLAVVVGGFAKRFDGNVQAFPLPDNFPPDLYRIQLTSSDGTWEFAGALSYVASAWKQVGQTQSDPLSIILQSCLEPIESHIRDNHVHVGRLGLVISRACQVEAPAQALIDRFCNNDAKEPASANAPLRNSTNFEIHNHKRYELPIGLLVNSWVRCRTASVKPEAPASMVTVEQDINTLAEESDQQAFDPARIRSFFESVVNEADAILTKYFPSGDTRNA